MKRPIKCAFRELEEEDWIQGKENDTTNHVLSRQLATIQKQFIAF